MVQRNQITPIKTPSLVKPTTADTNKAQESWCLLDIISEVRNVAIALGQFQNKHADDLSDGDVKELDVMIYSLDCIYEGGRR